MEGSHKVRGKQANASAARRERLSAESELEAGRRKIRDLLRERDDARERVNAMTAEHRAQMEHMRTLLAECVAPEVISLRAQLESLRTEHRALKQKQDERQKRWDTLCTTMHEHFVTDHHMPGAEAMEMFLMMVTGLPADELPVLEDPEVVSRKLNIDQLISMSRARGRRRVDSVRPVPKSAHPRITVDELLP